MLGWPDCLDGQSGPWATKLVQVGGFCLHMCINSRPLKRDAPIFSEKHVNVLFSIFIFGCAFIKEKEKKKRLAHLTNAPMFSDDIVYALFFSFFLILSAGNGRHDWCVDCWIVLCYVCSFFENEIEIKRGLERHDTRWRAIARMVTVCSFLRPTDRVWGCDSIIMTGEK